MEVSIRYHVCPVASIPQCLVSVLVGDRPTQVGHLNEAVKGTLWGGWGQGEQRWGSGRLLPPEA